MPISKSTRKALRSSLAKHQRNAVIKSKLRETIKKTNGKNLGEAYAAIDKAVKKNIIHKNKAAHLKSALSKKMANKVTIVSKVGKTTRKVIKNKKKK